MVNFETSVSETVKVEREESESQAAWVERMIRDYISGNPTNNLGMSAGEKAVEDPLVGFSNGADPLYEDIKKYAGSIHWTPHEIFTITFPDLKVQPDELTVISWVQPMATSARKANRKQTHWPSEEWVRARIIGKAFKMALREDLAGKLKYNGFPAVAPRLLPIYEEKKDENGRYTSSWSERHIAYVSGLGTFGLCDALITPKGKAVRLGSVVARIQIPPTPRPYDHHRAYCLYYTHNTCGKCMKRCPVESISPEGHDHDKCDRHISPGTVDYIKSNFGFNGYSCGLCQSGIPCESKIPLPKEG